MHYLFVDLDGTLLEDNRGITPLNKEAMTRFRQAGHKIVICTGRNYFEVMSMMAVEQFPYDYMILNNGGHIIDHRQQTLFERKISRDIGIAILKQSVARSQMWSFWCDGHKSYSTLDHHVYDQSCDNREVDIDFMAEAKKADGFQILCFAQDDHGFTQSQSLMTSIKEDYCDEVDVHQNQYFVDIVPIGCSKASGIDVLLDRVSDEIETIYTIGDSYNDLPMILRGDVGCTFTYAPPDIQSKAQRVYDYVYELINDILKENQQ